MTKKSILGRLLTSPARGSLWLVIILLSIASSRLPVEASTQRFGCPRPKKTRICLSEQSGSSLQVKRVQRADTGFPSDLWRVGLSAPKPSFRASSRVAESRLAVGLRRPDYLDSFASSSPHSDLPPPRAD